MTVLKNKAECVILSASHPSPSSGRTRGTVISIDAITTSNDDDDDFRTKTFFEINLPKMIDILGNCNTSKNFAADIGEIKICKKIINWLQLWLSIFSFRLLSSILKKILTAKLALG